LDWVISIISLGKSQPVHLFSRFYISNGVGQDKQTKFNRVPGVIGRNILSKISFPHEYFGSELFEKSKSFRRSQLE